MSNTASIIIHQRGSANIITTHPRWRASLASMGLMWLSAFAASSSSAQTAPKEDWGVADIPSQKNHIFLVTGGTSGIGYETAKALAAAGAQVIIAARHPGRGQEAVTSILQATPGARVRFETLDLGDLASVRALGAQLRATLPRLDGLINNAGIMEPPERQVSADGYEMQFAVNYLGHFALTAELLPLLRKSAAPRVVTLSSIAARRGALHFDDLQFEKEYDSFDAYAQSKIACLMFGLELQRRSEANGWGIESIVSHPGVSRTNLLAHHDGFAGFMRRRMSAVLFQPAEDGALPTLFAATAAEADGGSYYGPTRFMETRGDVGLAEVPEAAKDRRAIARLWTLSEELTGSRYSAQPAIAGE